MKRMMKAWIQKVLGIRSPSCNAMGFDYEYDYLISKKRKEKREKQVEHGRWLESSEYLTLQQWIPFSERQPDTGAHILITVLWEKGVDTAFDDDYEVMEEDWGVGEHEIKEGTATPLVQRIHERAIAWMPMPKEYRGGK